MEEIRTILKDLLDVKIRIDESELSLLEIEYEMYRGAEAAIYRAKYAGIDAIVKWRFPKLYMPRDLDVTFRENRTRTEAKALLHALRIGVRVPVPLYVDPLLGILIMEFIPGAVLRDVVDSINSEQRCKICREIGRYAAKLHMAGLIHGDLTTSNVIIGDNKIVLIDFGLAEFSKRLEDHAIDVHIMFRSIESTHYNHEKEMKECFIEGYREIAGDNYTKFVLRVVEEIRRSGRYVAERRARTEWKL